MKTSNERFWELDSLRAIAIIMMMVFHFLFLLWFVKGIAINVTSGFWKYFALVCALLFMTCVGISLYISHVRKKKTFFDHLKRAVFVGAWACTVTLATGIVSPANIVLFGVLHFVAVAIVVSYPFITRPRVSFVAALIVYSLKAVVGYIPTQSRTWVWLGIRPEVFATLDYFPLIPWLSVVLLGIVVGNVAYPHGTRSFRVPDYSHTPLIRTLTWMGRNSLAIYILHIPLLYVLVTFI